MYRAAVVLILATTVVYTAVAFVAQPIAIAIVCAILQFLMGVSAIYLLPTSSVLTTALACILTCAILLAIITPFLPIPSIIPPIAFLLFTLFIVFVVLFDYYRSPNRSTSTSISLPGMLPSPTSSSTSFRLSPSRQSHEKNINSVSSNSTEADATWTAPELESLDPSPQHIHPPRIQLFLLQAQISSVLCYAIRVAATKFRSHAKPHAHVFQALDAVSIATSAIFISLALYQHGKASETSQPSTSGLASQSVRSSISVGPYTSTQALNPRPRTHSLTIPLPLLEQQSHMRASCATTNTVASSRSSAQSPKKMASVNLNLSLSPSSGSFSTPSKPKRAFTIRTVSSTPSTKSSSTSYPSPPPSPSDPCTPIMPSVIRSKSKGGKASGNSKRHQFDDDQQLHSYLAGMVEMGLITAQGNDEDFRDLRDPFAAPGVVHQISPASPPSPTDWTQVPPYSKPQTTEIRTGLWSNVDGNVNRKGRQLSQRGRARAQRMSAWGRLQIPLPPLTESSISGEHPCRLHGVVFSPTSLPNPGSWIACTCTTPSSVHSRGVINGHGNTNSGTEEGISSSPPASIGIDLEEALLAQQLLMRLDLGDGVEGSPS